MKSWARKTLQRIACVLLVVPVCASAYVSSADIPPPPIPPENVYTVTLKEAIMLMLRYSPAVRNAELSRITDKFSLALSRANYLPIYSLQAAMSLNKGSEPVYTVTPGVSITTPLGTMIQSTISSSFGGVGDQASVTTTITQPLLQGFGSDINLIPWQNALDNEVIAKLAFKQVLISQVTSIINAYYNVAQSKMRLEVAKRALENSEESLKQIKIQIKAGVAKPNDVYTQESQVASQKIALVTATNTLAQNYQSLKVLIGLDPGAKIDVVEVTGKLDIIVPNVEESKRLILANNIGYQTALLQLKQQERSLLQAKDQARPNLTANASITTSIFSDVGGAGTSGGSLNDRSFSLSLDVPIDNLSNISGIVSAKVALEQSHANLLNQRRDLITTVINAVNDFKASKEQIALSERDMELSQKNLEDAIKEYRFGKISSLDVTTYRQRAVDSANNLIDQKINYVLTLANFYQNLGVTLERWNIEVNY